MNSEEYKAVGDEFVQGTVEGILLKKLDDLADMFRAAKPDDKSAKDRIYAMCITHLQEAAALFDRHVVRA